MRSDLLDLRIHAFQLAKGQFRCSPDGSRILDCYRIATTLEKYATHVTVQLVDPSDPSDCVLDIDPEEAAPTASVNFVLGKVVTGDVPVLRYRGKMSRTKSVTKFIKKAAKTCKVTDVHRKETDMDVIHDTDHIHLEGMYNLRSW